MKKIKNGKIRKQIFIYFCIVIVVVFAFFGLAGVSRKVKAGVIIDEQYTLLAPTRINKYDFNDNIYAGVSRISTTQVILLSVQVPDSDLARDTYFSVIATYITGDPSPLWRLNITVNSTLGQNYGLTARQLSVSASVINVGDYTYFLLDIKDLKTKLGAANVAYNNLFNNEDYDYVVQSSSFGHFFQKQNIISSVNNIYDLEQNDLALIYISDISGIALSMHDEITINWGYIDSTDNTIYRVHAPAVQAQVLNAQAQTIRLAVPTNAAGDVLSYYDIDQRSILTTITTGGATATAHIYGLYVWLQANRIQWGLAEFDTSALPASGASMNYITSMTSLYDYTAINTSTMTCRLSISNNFNFITIKNQNSVDVASVNAVIRQGGFLPAWAVYNWARGSASGYVSGEQAGAAPYQPGNAGYQSIYDEGYRAGVNANVGTVNWFVSAFSAVDAFLSIHIFPNITFGALLGIPFIISVVWFIIRTFRGGGGGN